VTPDAFEDDSEHERPSGLCGVSSARTRLLAAHPVDRYLGSEEDGRAFEETDGYPAVPG